MPLGIKGPSAFSETARKMQDCCTPKEELEHIWNKYYKSKKDHQRAKIGTGLGLSIVKQILELHNYSYGVTSTKEKGTNFYFRIPK